VSASTLPLRVATKCAHRLAEHGIKMPFDKPTRNLLAKTVAACCDRLVAASERRRHSARRSLPGASRCTRLREMRIWSRWGRDPRWSGLTPGEDQVEPAWIVQAGPSLAASATVSTVSGDDRVNAPLNPTAAPPPVTYPNHNLPSKHPGKTQQIEYNTTTKNTEDQKIH